MNVSWCVSDKVHVQQWSFVNAVRASKGDKYILNYAEERNATLLRGFREDCLEKAVQIKTRVTVQELPLQWARARCGGYAFEERDNEVALFVRNCLQLYSSSTSRSLALRQHAQ